MIRINLLPEELVPRFKTPLLRFIVIIVGVAIIVSAFFVYLFLALSKMPNERMKKVNAVKDVEQKKLLAAKYDDWEADIAFFKLRIDAVRNIRKSRFIWSKKLFELHRVIESAEDIALDEITVESQRSAIRGAAPQMAILMDGYSIVPELKSVADFMTKLRNSEFYKDCESIRPEETIIRQKDGIPVCEFSLRIVLKPQGPPPVPKVKKRKRRAKK